MAGWMNVDICYNICLKLGDVNIISFNGRVHKKMYYILAYPITSQIVKTRNNSEFLISAQLNKYMFIRPTHKSVF